jgi:tetratricopeptide (TPR) repeat protein
MDSAHTIVIRAAWAALVLSIVQGCAATPSRNLDADALWQSAERRHPAAIEAVVERHRLESDYATIIRISRDGALRGQAFMRLAELDVVLGDYQQAHRHLEQSLRADMPPEQRRRALLMLGDLMERHLGKKRRAVIAYTQIVNEYPGTPETELAALRLKVLNREP